MPHATNLTRLAAALVYSGIFWGTILFLVNACAFDRRVPFAGVVASQSLFAVAR